MSTALPPSPHTTVGDECSQQGSGREGHQEDGDRDTNSSNSTETSCGRLWLCVTSWVYRKDCSNNLHVSSSKMVFTMVRAVINIYNGKGEKRAVNTSLN